MNKFFIIGNLTRDPEFTQTQSGTDVCRFTVAVSRNYTESDGERKTDFFDCTAWRKVAENVARYCVKGNKIAVSGSVQLRQWEDNQGVKHNAVDVIAQDVEFLTPKTDRQVEETTAQSDSRGASRKPVQQRLRDYEDDGSDIPF